MDKFILEINLISRTIELYILKVYSLYFKEYMLNLYKNILQIHEDRKTELNILFKEISIPSSIWK